MNKLFLALIFGSLFLVSQVCEATIYYVDNSAANCTNYNSLTRSCGSGTYRCFTSIGQAEDVARAGDTVYVRAGTYDERVACGYSGSETGGYINFAAYPGEEAMVDGDHRTSGTVVMRGFDLASKSYIRIIGFEITHSNTSYSRAIVLTGTCSHLEILYNYIHNTNGEGGAIRAYGATTSNIAVRGNEVYYANCVVPGVTCAGNGWAVQGQGRENTTYWLVEYNNFHRVGDFVNMHGTRHIVRNNFMHDYKNSYFTGGGGHVDFYQCGSDGVDTGIGYHVYESNFLGDNAESDSHVLQMRDTVLAGDLEVVFRGNVSFNLGSYALQAGGIDFTRLYNNTYYQMQTVSTGSSCFQYRNESGNPSTGNHHFNNVIVDLPSGGVIGLGTSCTVTAGNNLCYDTPSHASCRSTGNPLFNDPGSEDFALQSGSPARNLGKAVTTVTSSGGSGRSFTVGDANFFCDGFGIAEGDRIIVGSNNPARITGISGNTITVDRSISWSMGDNVVLAQMMNSASPDAGAYPYRSGGYGISCDLSLNDGDNVPIGSSTITAAVNDSDLVRFVEFWIDGIPVGVDYDSPYQYTWDTSKEPVGSRHMVKAIARPLYASKTLAYEDRAEVVIGSGVLPSPPPNLRIR